MPLESPKQPLKRTITQNKALHKYFELIAQELQNQGQTMQGVIKKIDMCEITPTTRTVKEIIFKPIQEATLGKKSTTELTTSEINQVYEIMSMFLAKEFEISIPFPSYEQSDNYIKSYDNLPNS
jgi:hypothetical protein